MQRKVTGGFRKLIVWQAAKKLALKMYEITKKLPKEEQYHLVQQLRRAASSIMANIAEGSAMQTKVHRDSYFVRARGSTAEVDSFIELACDLQLVSASIAEDIQDHCARLSYLLTKLIGSS